MNTFRYIPSGFEGAAGAVSFYREYPELCIDILDKMRDSVKDRGIEFGVLSNAYTEQKEVEEYFKIFTPENIKTYTDSGGLQVITRGLNITDEIKLKIYSKQYGNSDFAMCFDELPVTSKGISSVTGFGINTASKYFVDSLFQINGTQTGKNIVEQIRIFKQLEKEPENREKLKTKIIFILQGKDFETLREFCWFAFQEIKKEPNYEEYIGGLALGNTSNTGTANLTDFILRFQNELEFLPSSWLNNLHILGAGTVTKIFSFFLLPDTYFDNLTLSADSTTQTKAMQFGQYKGFDNNSNEMLTFASLGRDINSDSLKVIEVIWNYHKDLLLKYNSEAQCLETFREHFTQYNDDLRRLRDEFESDYEYKKRSIYSKFLWSTKLIQDFLFMLSKVKIQSEIYRKGETKEAIKALKEIKKMLTIKPYKTAVNILKISSYNDYMKGSEHLKLKGHPYKTELDVSLKTSNPIINFNNELWITDTWNGKFLGRVLNSSRANRKINYTSNIRTKILSNLDNFKMSCLKTTECEASHSQVCVNNLDEW